jgi:hypothetical protein
MTGYRGTAGDPATGEHGSAGDTLCLNCGTRRIGGFCHACGQSAHVHRSMGAIGHDLAHGVFHVEGRVWRTLPLLLFRPGELTRRYVAGERARFVSPLALFLFIVFVLFAMLSVVGAHLEMPEFEGDKADHGRIEITRSIAANGESAAGLGRQRAAATDPAAAARLDARIAHLNRETATMETALAAMSPGHRLPWLETIHTGWPRLDKGLATASENPNLILYKLQSNAYKFAWALIPFSLPFMWLLFPFSRRFTLYDHAVFVTYSLCFVSLFGIVLSLSGTLGIAAGTLMLIASVLVPLHLYKQLRGAYGIGRIGAALRMVLLFVGANVALIAFALLLVGLGLVG